MTKRLKVYLLIVFAAACLACTLVGCKIGQPGRAELLAGYDSHVTYYSNGGYFNDSNTINVMDIYYKAGDGSVPFFFVTAKTSTEGMKISRSGYDLKGWYEPAKYTADDGEKFAAYIDQIKYEITYTPDAEGNISPNFVPGSPNNLTEPVFPVLKDGNSVIDIDTDRPVYARMDADGNLRDEQIKEINVTVVCDEDKPVAYIDEEDEVINDFELVKDDAVEVCAKWELSASISYHLIVTDEEGNVISDADSSNPTYYHTVEIDDDGNEKVIASYKNEDPVSVRPMRGDNPTPLNMQLVEIQGLTFVKTFMDKELTVPVHSVPRPASDEDPIVHVYCRYIVGKWTVISTANSVSRLFTGLGNETNFLILPEVGTEFDCSNVSLHLRNRGESNSTVVVEGDVPVTLSNLNFDIYGTVMQGNRYSIFGDITSSFKVLGAGLILKDISITLPRTFINYNFNAICRTADAAASPNVNLTIDSVKVTYESDVSVINYGNLNGWLTGGADLTQFTGLKIVDAENTDKYYIQPAPQEEPDQQG